MENQKSRRILICTMTFVLLSGCSFYREMDVRIEGTKLKTPYGSGDADINYESKTKIQVMTNDRCPKD